MNSKVKFKVGDIEFEAEGTPEITDHNLNVFINSILPTAVEAQERIYRDVKEVKNFTKIAEPENKKEQHGNHSAQNFSRTSLVSYLKDFGTLSEQDFVLTAAYFDEKKNSTKSFSSKNVKQYYTDARRPRYSNNGVLLKSLTKKGFIMDDTNAKKAGPKHYILTDEGIQYVENYKPKKELKKRQNLQKKEKNTIKKHHFMLLLPQMI